MPSLLAANDPALLREREAFAPADPGPCDQLFFEEADEHLDRMEQQLLALDLARTDGEALNALFRCAHSIKGGAAAFGFGDVAGLAHALESLLDRLRRHGRRPTGAMVDTLLESVDALRGLLAARQGHGAAPPATADLLLRIGALARGGAAPAAGAQGEPDERVLDIHVGPLANPAQADGIAELFRDIPELGRIEALPCDRATHRAWRAHTRTAEAELMELFTFHVSKEDVRIADAAPAPAMHHRPAATLRVAVGKVDRLIDLLDELAIAQTRLARQGRGLRPPAGQALQAGLAELERRTRELQDAVRSIRTVPISTVFDRFPRLLRELGGQLGKRIELVTRGGAIELDKGLVEQVAAPLTHLVRNSCDHGIETPPERCAQGKPAHGTVTLSAAREGGAVRIEVRDDGRGLSRDKLLAKARAQGLDAPGTLTDAEVWRLIFVPGFSTAEAVTDVSGRGVGMDVVRQHIAALGGSVAIDSAENRGLCVTVRLPLAPMALRGQETLPGPQAQPPGPAFRRAS